ncbi:hypothetical protein AMAG_18632 [Allomyces macrogynus ATCC 38327]|uniref:Uncharacterized protein n=1 Tax=Allomyces macrogynus (strain ATCC 38327) TaxID=578462 RepID=A0A0L0SG59_ALLM3|nr:hypothetical protein AMAG_18632 [Allomyces macrogynus ATCC 38327]|eukprot:KNE61452.1 hypothetical protein AMAG_18632 [Allomyces macrogynus ATCC 38327]
MPGSPSTTTKRRGGDQSKSTSSTLADASPAAQTTDRLTMAKKKAQEKLSADKDKPDARQGLVLRLANVVATAVFCRAAYGRYARGYDAETAQWVAFYVMCAINTLANVFPKAPVDPPYMIAYLIGIYNMLGSLQADGIMTPHGLLAPGGAPVAPLDGSPPAAPSTTLQAVFNLSTSGGRDRSAVVMALYWLFLGRVIPRVLSYMLVVGAAAVTAAAVALPAFGYTTLADVRALAHAHGLSFSGRHHGAGEDGQCGILPPGHAPVDGGMCAGGAPRTCPFTGKTVTWHDAKPVAAAANKLVASSTSTSTFIVADATTAIAANAQPPAATTPHPLAATAAVDDSDLAEPNRRTRQACRIRQAL